MLLALDIGNSFTTLAVYDHEWIWQHRLQTHRNGSQEEYERELRRTIPPDVLTELHTAVIGSVVPALTLTVREAIASLIASTPFVITPSAYSYLDVLTDTPGEVGVDLIANAVSAYTRHRKPCIIADFETALTFTAVGGTGGIHGVVITPGMQTAMRSLFNTTSQLPEVRIETPPHILGKNTTQAMQSGIVHGYIGLTKHIMKNIEDEMGVPCVRIGTGGLSFTLKSRTDLFDEFDPYLTVDGYRLLSQELGVYRTPNT
jgi:type III pantothenate kinase